MTLASAIKSMGNGLILAEEFMRDKNVPSFGYQIVKQALAALPEPMTEEEILDVIDDATEITLEGETILIIIAALRDHDVLFVKE